MVQLGEGYNLPPFYAMKSSNHVYAEFFFNNT